MQFYIQNVFKMVFLLINFALDIKSEAAENSVSPLGHSICGSTMLFKSINENKVY
jgi:hypothetical protein